MTRVSPEEGDVIAMLPAEGANLGALHIAPQLWAESRMGRLFSVTMEDILCHVWLAEIDWQKWCEGTLGTYSEKDIDPQLLTDIAEWGLSPLLQTSGAKLHYSPGKPVYCSMLKNYVAVVFGWQIDGYPFRAVLFGWPATWFRTVVQQIPPRIRPVHLLPPIAFTCYAGWCLASVHEMRFICSGTGLRMNPFGRLRDGEFVILLATGKAARVCIEQEGYVEIKELADDMESLLAEEGDDSSSPLSFNLDSLPQKLLIEVGQIDITFGSLKTLREGDLIATETRLSSEVKLRLNGRVIGLGELIACGDSFLVRVTQWFLHSADTLVADEDKVNTR